METQGIFAALTPAQFCTDTAAIDEHGFDLAVTE